MVALEGYTEAKRVLDTCLEEKQGCLSEREHLATEIESLKSQISILEQMASDMKKMEKQNPFPLFIHDPSYQI